MRVAAAYGHEDAVDANFTSTVSTNGTSIRPHSTNDGVSLSLMHVATGLFAQGFYNEYTRGHDIFSAGGPSGFSTAGVTKDTAKQWQIQAGIARNWFGIGNTALYGEYSMTRNGFNTFGLEGAGSALTANGGGGLTSATATGVAYVGDNTKNRMWGLGVQQDLDAAAMQIFAGYRNFSLSSDNCSVNGGCKDISMFIAGSKIRF